MKVQEVDEISGKAWNFQSRTFVNQQVYSGQWPGKGLWTLGETRTRSKYTLRTTWTLSSQRRTRKSSRQRRKSLMPVQRWYAGPDGPVGIQTKPLVLEFTVLPNISRSGRLLSSGTTVAENLAIGIIFCNYADIHT